MSMNIGHLLMGLGIAVFIFTVLNIASNADFMREGVITNLYDSDISTRIILDGSNGANYDFYLPSEYTQEIKIGDSCIFRKIKENFETKGWEVECFKERL